jgi:hypothetical protein
MNIGDVLGEAWDLYTRFFTRVVPLALMVFLVLNFVSALLVVSGGGTAVFLAVLSLVIAVVGNFWLQGALVEATVDMRDGTFDSSTGDLFRRVRPILGTLIGAGLLAGLGIAIGLVLLIVPGLYLMTRWAMIAPVVVREHTGIGAAFTRSAELVRGSGWRVFGLVLIVGVLSAVVGSLVSVILNAVLPEFLGTWLGGTIGNAVVVPFGAIAITLAYLRLVDRRPAGEPSF